jgi:hypothetical protein
VVVVTGSGVGDGGAVAVLELDSVDHGGDEEGGTGKWNG